MDEKIMKLQKLIDQHDNIVFLAERECPRRAESLISVPRTDYIIRNMIILRRLS